MSNCPTSLPLSQLTDTDEFKNILSGEDLLNLTDPTKQLNQALLLATTDTINDKLDGQKTKESPSAYTFDQFKDDYPTLSQRIQDGPLTPAEVAIFATESGATLQSPLSSAFDNPVAGNETEGATTGDSIANGQVSLDFRAWTPGSNPTAQIAGALALLDTFLDDNIGASLAGGQCAAFAALGNSLQGLLQSMKAKADSLDSIPGLDLKKFTLSEILSGEVIKVKIKLELIGKLIKDTVEKVIKKVESQAASLVASLTDLPNSLQAQLNKAQAKVKAFTSDKNKNGIMDGIDKMIANVGSMFEKLTPAVLGLLMFRFCQVTNAIQKSSETPLKSLMNTVNGIKETQKIMKSESAKATKTAVESGATRMDADEVEDQKEKARTEMRERSTKLDDLVEGHKSLYGTGDGFGELNVDKRINNNSLVYDFMKSYPRPKRAKDLPKELRPYVSKLGNDTSITGGIGPIKFKGGSQIATTQLRKNGDDTGAPGPGWTLVQTKVWVQILDMAHQLDEDLIVTKGFDYESKSKYRKKGQIVTIELPDDDITTQLRYLIAASRAGLKGMKIRANPGSITVGNVSRGGWLGKNLQKEYDDLFKGDNVNERADSFIAGRDKTSIFALRSALTDHRRDAWYPRVAIKNDK